MGHNDYFVRLARDNKGPILYPAIQNRSAIQKIKVSLPL